MYNPPFGDDLGFTFVGAYTPPDGGGLPFNFITDVPSPVLVRANVAVPFDVSVEAGGEVRATGQVALVLDTVVVAVAPPAGVAEVAVTPVVVAVGAGPVYAEGGADVSLIVSAVGGTRTDGLSAYEIPFVTSAVGRADVWVGADFDLPFVVAASGIGPVRSAAVFGLPWEFDAEARVVPMGVSRSWFRILPEATGAIQVEAACGITLPATVVSSGVAIPVAEGTCAVPFAIATVGAGPLYAEGAFSVPLAPAASSCIPVTGGMAAEIDFSASAQGYLHPAGAGVPSLPYTTQISACAGRAGVLAQEIEFVFSTEGGVFPTADTAFEVPFEPLIEACASVVCAVVVEVPVTTNTEYDGAWFELPFDVVSESASTVFADALLTVITIEAVGDAPATGTAFVDLELSPSANDAGVAIGRCGTRISPVVASTGFVGAQSSVHFSVPLIPSITAARAVTGHAAAAFSFGASAAARCGTRAVGNAAIEMSFFSAGLVAPPTGGVVGFSTPFSVKAEGGRHVEYTIDNVFIPTEQRHIEVYIQ